MTKGEKVLSTSVGILMGIICMMTVWLALADMAKADAKARAEAVEELNRKLRSDYADVSYDLARCRASVKVVTQTKYITKKVPGSWWSAPITRDTLIVMPDSISTWLWDGQ